MSRFFSDKYAGMTPYTPGEQPKARTYIKLNTNESPFPPEPETLQRAVQNARSAELYCDPDCTGLSEKVAALYGIEPDEVVFTNGSDDALNFAFMAFCDESHPAAFADITYGFYPVFAELNRVPYRTIPLNEDFTIRVEDYIGIGHTIFIANPNAPTGIALPLSAIEQIVSSNPDNVVIIDEAYVDFGAESAVSLIHKYPNLLVTQTFSKSRSMAGARLGMAIGCKELIRDLNTLRYSTNPYNVNSMTQALGEATLENDEYTRRNCQIIMENRAYTAEQLSELGFEMTDSKANFLFARHPAIDGGALYRALKDRGVLVRHFDKARISDYNRITVGDIDDMNVLLSEIKNILGETI